MRSAKSIYLILIVGLITNGCLTESAPKVPEAPNYDTVVTGSVEYVELEGGVWTIEGSDDETYQAMNLPESYQQDGLRVKAYGTIRKDMGSIYMVGPILDIQKIERH